MDKLRVDTGNAFKRKDYAATVRLATKVRRVALGISNGRDLRLFEGPGIGSSGFEIIKCASGCLVSNVAL